MATKVAFLPSCSPSFCGYTVQQPNTCPKGCPWMTKKQDSHTRPCPSRMLSWYKHILVVFPILKSISPWEGFSHILWKIRNVFSSRRYGARLGFAKIKKCSKTPTSINDWLATCNNMLVTRNGFSARWCNSHTMGNRYLVTVWLSKTRPMTWKRSHSPGFFLVAPKGWKGLTWQTLNHK